jgi:hexosaminidase
VVVVPLVVAGLVVTPAAPAVTPSFASVIPKPLAEAPERGAFTLGPAARIAAAGGSPDVLRVGRLLAGALRPATGFRLPVTRTGSRAGDIVLSLAPGDRSLGDEGYRLRVDQDGATITARRPAGLFWGTQTLRQLLPAAIETGSRVKGPWRIPQGTIHDSPRFVWRGMMLDVARHFFGVDEVKRLIDLMALYKLNRLHLHLTDDQGWRLAIRSWPRLTKVGGRTAVNGDKGGFYTQRQYRAIVAYAQARFVEVVPEIDMPGHVNAALASYPRLTCAGKAPALYTGIDVGFSSLCLDKELTYSFLDDVIGEVAALTPGLYIHIGGDEAHSTDPADYRRFVERVQQIVRAHGKRMIGWEEIARARLRRTSVAQHWQDAALAQKAVEQGAKVVLSPATKAYLDMKYTPSYPFGLVWAGTTSLRDAYEWDPGTQIRGVPEKSILGVEAALWSETIDTRKGLDALAFPRLLGLAERAWSPAGGRSWSEYRTRLAAQGLRLAALGVAFHASPEVPWQGS